MMAAMKRLLLAAFATLALDASAWTAPDHADPQAILREAVEDRIAGRYEDALQKHVWFHKQAVKASPALVGVRRSFALAYWAHLASKYPPAMEALKKARDDAGEDVRAGRDATEAFRDYAAIDDELDDPLATVSLFLSIEKSDRELARKLYPAAEDALLDAKYFEVAGRYVDPPAELKRVSDTYRQMAKRAPPSPELDMKSLNERFFAAGAGRLVALMVIVDRKPEADRIAEQALAVSDSATVKAAIDQAKQGRLPPPFISREDRQNLKSSM
jgi:hypothetical protein